MLSITDNNVTLGPNSVSLSPRQEKKEVTVPEARTNTKRPVTHHYDTSSPNINYLLQRLENQRCQKVMDAVHHRYQKFEDFTIHQNEHLQKQWVIQQQKAIQDMENRERRVLEILEECGKSSARQNNEQLIKHYQELNQKKHQYEEQLQKNREKQKIMTENVAKLKQLQIEFRTVYEEIAKIIKSCDINKLKNHVGDNMKLLKTLPAAMEEIIVKCKQLEMDSEHISKAINVTNELKRFKREILDAILKMQRDEEEAVARKEKQTTESHDQLCKIDGLERFASKENLERFMVLKKFLAQYASQFEDLSNDQNLKQFKFDLKKAVNLPVNAISAVSASHLTDKYIKISALLSGKNVLVSGKQVNATKHPQGIFFCTDLLARKFVLQADLMMSTSPEAAFCYASMIVTLWKEFPDFGRLLMGHFFNQCPYLLPFNMPKTAEQTDEEYYKSLGYRYTNGEVEKQDQFLRRMTGMLRLYFAITIAKPRGGGENLYNITHAWNFIVSLLKLEPQLDVTATSLYVFFEMIGFQMMATYGRAFKKIVQLVIEQFLPKLKEIDSGGPVSRLKIILQDYKKKGHFDKPPGLLSKNFW